MGIVLEHRYLSLKFPEITESFGRRILEKPLAVAAGFLTIALFLGLCFALPVNGGDADIPPVAAFTYSPAAPYKYEPVIFDGSASFDPDGFICSYAWDFGDGNLTVVRYSMEIHSYTEEGEYSVTLTVTDNLGATNSITRTLRVRSHVLASFSYSPPEPHVHELVSFDATNSTGGDGMIASYAWDFGDGNNGITSTPFVQHFYAGPKTYNVTLNVTSSNGDSDVDFKVVNVTALPKVGPRAFFTWAPAVPLTGQPVEFNASESTPDGGTIVSYTWDFGDGTTQVVAEPTLTHVYQAFGTYTVLLNVTDSDGFSNATDRSIPVIEKPLADFFYVPKEPRVCGVVTFNASVSDPRGGHIVRFEWNFGNDSSVESGVVLTHRFRKIGEYVVSLNVTDSENLWDVKNVTVKVLPHIADLNEDGVVNILDITIFARAHGSFPGSPRWNPRADLNGDGKVNILDGVVIARSYNMCIDNPIDP